MRHTGEKVKMQLVAQHRSGTVQLYRREDNGRLVRVTHYPESSVHKGTLYVVMPETFLASVRGWQTWEVFEDTGRLL